MRIRKIFSWVLFVALLASTTFTPSFAGTEMAIQQLRNHNFEKAQPASPQTPNDIHTVCASGCDFSSIQAAIDIAVDGDTIDLASEIYTETITIDKSIDLIGDGMENTIVQAAGVPGVAANRVITVTSGITVTIDGLTIRYGNATGISSPKNEGGGIFTQGKLNVINSKIFNNSAELGGGILNDSDIYTAILTLTNTTISQNSAVIGGGIYNNGLYQVVHLYIGNSTISDNTAYESGGDGGAGGGLYNNGVEGGAGTIIEGSTFSNNSADWGGGIYNNGGYGATSIFIEQSTFSNNTAVNVGGGIYSSGYNGSSTIYFYHSTFSNNSASIGGGIVNSYSRFDMETTIIADSNSGGDCFNNSGTINDYGYLIIEDGSCINHPTSSSGDPLLDSLANNGGSTWTHALLPSSPAIDAIPAAECRFVVDQRGVTRPQGSGCDIGAFELGYSLSLIKSVNNPSPLPGETITFTIRVTNNLTETITDGVISDTLPAGLNFLDSIFLEPPLSGTLGSAPPILVTGLTIDAGEQITVTFPVSVSNGLVSGAIITNTALFTSSELITPVLGSSIITIHVPNTIHTVCANGCDFNRIQTAINTATNGDTIDLASEIYTEVITIDKSINLIGDGIENTIVQANAISLTTSFPVIYLSGNIDVALNNLTIQNGGRGIYASESNLIITNSKITNNGYGGGIYALDGNTIIENSIFSNNIANNSGGGIYNSGEMTITNSIIITNTTFNSGGGIYNQGKLFVGNSKISYNNSLGSGGGIGTSHGILSRTFINQSEITGNSATGEGGGIKNTGVFTLTNSTIQENYTKENLGGGILNALAGATFLLDKSTVEGNFSYIEGGGIYNAATLTVTQSTISGNQARTDYMYTNGGGIYVDGDSSVVISFSTITGNSASNGGGIVGDATIFSSIIANQVNGGDCAYSDNISRGFNLDSDGSCLDNPTSTDIPNTNPKISHLAPNGGPTWTHALLPSSPAIDAIPTAECGEITDQRGVSRPQGGGCDIGAFELEPSLALSKSVNNPSPLPGETITFTIQVTNNLTETVNGGVISDTLPTGLNFLDTITLEPSISGTIGSAPPILVTGLAIGAAERITVTLPISVSYGLPGGTTITNTAWVTSTEVLTPALGSAVITIANAPPVGVDDEGVGYSTDEDTAFTTANVLLNDTDPNGDTLAVSELITTTTLGLIIDNGDGTFEYDPNRQFDHLIPGEQAMDTFTYTVSDGELTDSAVVTITITGANDAPVVDAGLDQTTDEGELVQFEGSFSDPDSTNPDIHWDFGDGYAVTDTLTPTHTYLDDGVYTVTLTVTDTFGTAESDWLFVTVENVAPTLSTFPDLEITAGETITITGTITDPGVLDSQTVVITWESGATETIELGAAERQFSATYTYADAGLYPVTVRVTDKDGDWNEQSFSVTVSSSGYWVFIPIVKR